MFYISLLIIQVILFEAHFLLYRTVMDIFNVTGKALLILKIISVLLSVSFLAASLFAHSFRNKITTVAYRIAATWFGSMIYFLLAAAAYWIVFFSFGKEIPGANIASVKIVGELLFVAAAAVSIFGLVNANVIQVRRITVNIQNLPDSWKNRKVALLSDIHLGQIRGRPFAEKISKIIKSLSPDAVFFVGDVFDGVKVDADECVGPFSDIRTTLGNFFVFGNHEEFEKDSVEIYGSAIRKANIKILDNASIVCDGVEIIGVTDSDATNKNAYGPILEKIIGTEKKYPRILLKHTPVSTAIAEKNIVDLELSGHTHGGQVFPFNILTSLVFKNRNYGLSRFGKTTVYTSSGVGTWGPPMRIGANPEIVLISFENRPE